MKQEKTGHSILKYKVRLYDRHYPWLIATRELYTNVVSHFFSVLVEKEELLALSDFPLLRELETICIGTKDMKKAGVSPSYPLPEHWNIPLYFRRSAINAAIDLARKKVVAGDSLRDTVGQDISRVPMVLYQGMYREFSDSSIELKLFNGERWVWVAYPFTGRPFPKEAKRLSPILVLEKKTPWLEVPLSFPVEDIRTVQERMQEEDRICAVAFPDDDILAAAVLLSKTGEDLEHRMFRGGRRKEHQRQEVLAKIRNSQKSRGHVSQAGEIQENRQLLNKVKKINDYYVHKVSRELVDYCVERHIKVIVVPNYESEHKKRYGVDVYRWLGRSIIKKLKYKAFQQGIVVSSVRWQHSFDRDSSPLETARNIGERFLSYVPK